MPRADRRPVHHARHGPFVARNVSPMQRVSHHLDADLLQPRLQALLQSRLRQVSFVTFGGAYISCAVSDVSQAQAAEPKVCHSRSAKSVHLHI